MDKTQLQQKLTQPFDSNHWKEVVETVFPGSQFYSQERAIDSKEEIVEQIADKGTVRLADGKNIALVELRLKPGSVHLHRNRVKLRSLVAKLIDQERAHGVIAVFEQGEGDYRTALSPAKLFSKTANSTFAKHPPNASPIFSAPAKPAGLQPNGSTPSARSRSSPSTISPMPSASKNSTKNSTATSRNTSTNSSAAKPSAPKSPVV